MTANTLRAAAAPRARYVPDLNRLLEQCEHNYFTLLSLLEQAKVKDVSERAIWLKIVERDRYTTTLQLDEVRTASQFIGLEPRFIVRLYHDAKLAEVLQWHNRRILKGSYPYPNKAMLQRDEKQRVNDFLAEWLRSCELRRLAIHADDSEQKVSDLVEPFLWKRQP